MRINRGPLCQIGALLFACRSTVLALTGCRSREASFESPENAAHALGNCTVDTCSQLSSTLHLGLPPRPKVCSVGALRGGFEPDSEDTLRKIQCSQDFQLVLLTRAPHGRWQYANSMAFPWGAHDVTTVTLRRLIDPRDDDIVIHGDTVAFGTGVHPADFLVVQVSGRKLHVVLDTVETGSEEGLMNPPYIPVTQDSKFEVMPARDKNYGIITEVMTLNVVGKKIVVQREFDWRKQFGMFEPGFWYSLEPGTAKSERKKSG
jgi:hypothetical protein